MAQTKITDRRRSAVNRVCSIFSQLLQLFPRLEFEQVVKEHRAERHARGFTCWGQFVAMLFCHLGKAQSLREICGGLAAGEGNWGHWGVGEGPRGWSWGMAIRIGPGGVTGGFSRQLWGGGSREGGPG